MRGCNPKSKIANRKSADGSAQLSERLELARSAAREAGKLTLEFFQRADLAVERKADQSPVTAADREAEQLMRERIAAAFPDDAILGEEFPDRRGTSGYRWILDPIDGTKSFIHGVPLYGTLIGLEHGLQSVLGVIQIPALDECVYAAAGQGAWHVRGGAAPAPARVSQTPAIGRLAVLHQRSRHFRRARGCGRVRSLAGRRPAVAHLGRLLRLSARGHRPGRSDGRSDHERLGRRRDAADSSKKRAALSPIGKANRRSIRAKASPPMAECWPRC